MDWLISFWAWESESVWDMLFAPKSGNETRELILNKADQGKEFIKKQTATFRTRPTPWSRRAAMSSAGSATTISDAVQAGKQAYREKVEPRIS